MWYLEMGGVYTINNQKVFGRKIFIEPDKNKIKEIGIKKFNNTDVYTTIYQYNDKDLSKSDLYGPLYIDLDMEFNNDEQYQKLKDDLKRIVTYLDLQYDIPEEYIRFFFTGKKGFHLIIPAQVFGVYPMKNLNVLYKEIAKDLNNITLNKIVDTKIYDNKRLFRVANTINSKTGLYKVPISFENIKKFSYEEIKEYASAPKNIKVKKVKEVSKAKDKFYSIMENLEKQKQQKIKNIRIPKNIDFSKIKFTPCIQEIYKNGAVSGNRNNTTIILASAFFQKGISYDIALSLINKWNLEKNSPSLSDREIQLTVESAYNQVMNGRGYGCSSIKDADLCVGHKCKLYRK